MTQPILIAGRWQPSLGSDTFRAENPATHELLNEFPVSPWKDCDLALNVANSLTDIEEDARAGARTLAVALGVKRSFLVCRFLIVAGAAWIGILAAISIVPARPWIIVPILVVTCLAVGGMALFFGPEKPLPARKLHFYVVAITCIVLAGGWLIGVLV